MLSCYERVAVFYNWSVISQGTLLSSNPVHHTRVLGACSLVYWESRIVPKNRARSVISQDTSPITLSDMPTQKIGEPYQCRLTWIIILVSLLFGLSLLTVENLLCLVLLCLIPARRDKVCPLYRNRNYGDTNLLQWPQKLSGPLGTSPTTFPFFSFRKIMSFCLRKFENTAFLPLFARFRCSMSITITLDQFGFALCSLKLIWLGQNILKKWRTGAAGPNLCDLTSPKHSEKATWIRIWAVLRIRIWLD